MTQGNSCNMQAAFTELLSPHNAHTPVDEGRGRAVRWSAGLDNETTDVYHDADEADVIARDAGVLQGGNIFGSSFSPSFPQGGGEVFWAVVNKGLGTELDGTTQSYTVKRNHQIT